ncbi:hypothetical protein GE061_002808 [Apolygus lucorum]|uniref:Gustatory receptor n=1 Tax=Apolygus lucorum TaxID=248454 RepID=A0A6A4JAK5_APOLU|nr:hypothetical protein GE061_002808 [Apolygus lucorum]
MMHHRKTLRKAWNKLNGSETGLTFESIMFSFLMVMQVPTYLVGIYSWFFEVPAIVKCCNMTAVVEKRISDVFPTSTLTRRTRIFVTTLVGLYFLAVAVISIILLGLRFNEAPAFTIFSFVLCFSSVHSSCIAWCFNFWFTCCLATKLRDHMVMCLQVGQNRECKLKICRNIWMSIWKLSGKYADAFAYTVLFTLINNGVIFVISCYGIIASIRAESIADILTISPYFMTSLFNVALVLEMAHRARTNLGEKFLCSLMAMDKDTLDKGSVKEVGRFMSMINYSENAKITLKGFVTVDRELLVSFLSYSATYLIVLIQFQGKVDPRIDARMLPSNISEA